MPKKDNNILEYFEFNKNEKYILDKQDIGIFFRDLVSKSLDTKSHAKDKLSGRILQDKLFASEVLLSLRKIKFNE